MTPLLQILLAITAFSALCLSQQRHARNALGGAVSPGRRGARKKNALLGWSVLIAVVALSCNAPDWPEQLVTLCGALSIAALVIASCASWFPRRLGLLGLASGAAAASVASFAAFAAVTKLLPVP